MKECFRNKTLFQKKKKKGKKETSTDIGPTVLWQFQNDQIQLSHSSMRGEGNCLRTITDKPTLTGRIANEAYWSFASQIMHCSYVFRQTLRRLAEVEAELRFAASRMYCSFFCVLNVVCALFLSVWMHCVHGKEEVNAGQRDDDMQHVECIRITGQF